MESHCDSSTSDKLLQIKHHEQQELCTTRPIYRQGRKLTAVKVYTVSTESQHLFIYGIPSISLRSELKSICQKYGTILNIHVAPDYKTEKFTECYHVHYERIASARIAKRFLDNKSFYGSFLHVCYAPEYETVNETRIKLQQRQRDVLKRLYGEEYKKTFDEKKPVQVQRKRKYPALEITEERMKDLDPMIVWNNVPQHIDPRIPKNNILEKSVRKHFQMQSVEYGPQKPDDNIQQPNLMIVPQQVIKLQKKADDLNKKIVYYHRNKSE